ncbi:histidine phosphotransferase family protein [Aliiroseovarius subalbicans]|uniref:histidine phosphotransferase family protein n=1 Tax=Aliiroseovarius subalbicans TaxID=2925840 RepID=UPI001F567B9B|nr:histidine phosphotransferase family protein [Aliiroseovarius subalbicans]MCI2398307.1 histidine phosphotransferase family protein [Aliiroseovarius subalbicans]
MSAPTRDLNALLGSRICHDLISPLGAIGNGVELMQLSGQAESPEMALIAESVENANLRIRFFRIAFGAASDGQMVGEKEVRTVLAPGVDGRKLEIDWALTGDQPRTVVKVIFLILQCFESAMPWGGHLRVSHDGDHWKVAGEAERLKVDPDLWELLSNPGAEVDLAAAQVQFALIGPELKRQGRKLGLTVSEHSISVEF